MPDSRSRTPLVPFSGHLNLIMPTTRESTTILTNSPHKSLYDRVQPGSNPSFVPSLFIIDPYYVDPTASSRHSFSRPVSRCIPSAQSPPHHEQTHHTSPHLPGDSEHAAHCRLACQARPAVSLYPTSSTRLRDATGLSRQSLQILAVAGCRGAVP